MNEHLGHLLLFGVLLIASAFFCASEASLFSLGRMRLQGLLDSGHPRAKVLDLLLSQPRRLLVTILVGNELVNIAAAIVMASFWQGILGHEHGFWSVIAVSTATTLPLLLVFGEIIPKTVAVKNGEAVALVLCRPIHLFGSLISPLRWLLRGLADLCTRPFGAVPQPKDEPLSERDFRTLLDVSEQEGVIDAEEHQWIRNVLEFDDRAVKRIMTPKEQVTALPANISPELLLERVREAGYSRIPLHDGNPERIVGVLYTKDLLPFVKGGALEGLPPLTELVRTPLYVPQTLAAADVFRQLRSKRTHAALVVDEFGALVGLVTMEDLLEELFGEIADERDRDEALGGRRPMRSLGRVVSAATASPTASAQLAAALPASAASVTPAAVAPSLDDDPPPETSRELPR